MNSIHRLFEDKLLIDDRPAVFAFGIGVLEIDFLAPNYRFYFQVILLLLVQMLTGCIVGTLMYYGILRQRKNSPIRGYVVGYGICIPLCLMISFRIVDILDIRSTVLRLALCSTPMTVCLRCLQTMHGVIPLAWENSRWEYILSVAFTLRPKYDKDGRSSPITLRLLARSVGRYILWILVLALLYPFLAPFDFYPFSSHVDAQEVMFVYDFPNLYNSYFQLVLVNFSLGLSLTGVSILAALLTGVQFNDHVTAFPMFLSTSHSEFWGTRWNNLIHFDLKEGVYKPVRSRTDSKVLAALCTFVVSGIQHEHVWYLLFSPTQAQLDTMDKSTTCCSTCYCEAWFGRQLFMFSYAGLWMAVEYGIGELPRSKRTIPLLLQSHLFLLSLFLPASHHFTADITSSGYLLSLQQALPLFLVKR